MTAIELLESGTVKETFHVDQPIFRIGADPRSGVRLPLGEPHQLTVRTNPSGTRVINRSSQHVSTRNGLLPPQATLEWAPGQHLELGTGLTLRLRDDQRRPTRRSRRRADPTPNTSVAESNPIENTADRKDHTNIALLGCATILLMGLFLGVSGKTSAFDANAGFQQVVAGLTATGDPALHHIRSLIQEGRAYELRDMRGRAARKYGKALDILRASRGRVGAADESSTAPVIQIALRFAENGYRRVQG